MTVGPTLAELHEAISAFGNSSQPDRSYGALMAATGSTIDLRHAAHRIALHKWLNAWGCRIRYPREGEAPIFAISLADWWLDWQDRLPPPDAMLAALDETQIHNLAGAFGDLAARPAAPARTFGPTASAKSLYAIRPRAVSPWDDAIARRLHGRTDAEGFASHLRLMCAWSRALLDEAGASEQQVVLDLGRPTESLAKLLDEYCYMTITYASRRTAT